MRIGSTTFLVLLLATFSESAFQVHHCRVGRNDRSDYKERCATDECAIFKYSFKSYKERLCFSDLAMKHPAFHSLQCPHSLETALCYDKDSIAPIRSPLKFQEQTFGELLTRLDIDRFCCCKGELCNFTNDQMRYYYHQNRTLSPLRYYPGGQTSSGGSFQPAVLTILVALLLR
ncbi:hypothetical protein QR680_002320 [Steinernema hermaphroditum]|uniref:Uncharacterized protein n=1 Tax=Steinernema hermaphroditum TaxID=289476 RepID=A0AA39H362_9BILA|nr:hypothetical protein QR680_002320 [Steinernema hermaphroditum]